MKELLYGMTKQDYINAIDELFYKCDDLELLYFIYGFLAKKLS